MHSFFTSYKRLVGTEETAGSFLILRLTADYIFSKWNGKHNCLHYLHSFAFSFWFASCVKLNLSKSTAPKGRLLHTPPVFKENFLLLWINTVHFELRIELYVDTATFVMNLDSNWYVGYSLCSLLIAHSNVAKLEMLLYATNSSKLLTEIIKSVEYKNKKPNQASHKNLNIRTCMWNVMLETFSVCMTEFSSCYSLMCAFIRFNIWKLIVLPNEVHSSIIKYKSQNHNSYFHTL